MTAMSARMHRMTKAALAAAVLGGTLVLTIPEAAPASAAACSTSTGSAACTINTSVGVTAGTLSLESSPNLYWQYVENGYDQYASASASTLSGCTSGSSGTSCTGGTAPRLMVLDATGSGSGWALSSYLTANDLPSGSVFHFAGAGNATIGTSTNSPIATDPFAATTPGNVCDYGSSCTVATAAATCSHAGLGFSSCPTYPVNLAAGTGAAAQVDMYSANAATGVGALCFASGTATATGCTGTTSTAFYNLGIKGNTTAGTYATTVINISASTGP
jgi:hypothetical protein